MLTLIGQDGSSKTMIKSLLILFLPRLMYTLNVSFVDPGTCEFFATIIRNSIKSRKITNEKKGDFIDFLTDLAKEDTNTNLAHVLTKLWP